jgi:Fe2+ transport system protein FeoA
MASMFMMGDPPRPAPSPDAARQPLPGLPLGGWGRVVSVDASPVDRERLEVMGLCSGRRVCVIKHGDPMIVRVLGTRIGLAAALAMAVHVQPEAPATNQRSAR